ncbi:MAG: hypothetical protein FWH21_03035 [Kiritimatiellaeota bacterium]|nr:hypothetical protein [Kiritimatiellota bacterium]
MMKTSIHAHILMGLVGAWMMTSSAHAATPQELGIVSAGSPVVLGQWNAGYDQTRAVAFSEGIPMVVVWSNPNCSHCENFDKVLLTETFKNWMGNQKLVMHYQKGDTRSKTYDWCYNKGKGWTIENPSYFPLILLYWQKADGTVMVEQRRIGDSMRGGSGTKMTLAEQADRVISIIMTAFEDYRRTDQWDPDDDTQAGAQELMIGLIEQSQVHTLNVSDTNDWYRFTVAANATNLITFTDVKPVVGTPLYAFFNDTEMFANGTVTSNSRFEFANPSGDPSNIVMRIYYASGTNVDIEYTINYKEYVGAAVWFEQTAMTFSAWASTFEIPVVFSGDDLGLKTNAAVAVTASGMGANPYYTLVNNTLAWDETDEGKGVLTVTVTPHAEWVEMHTFDLTLHPMAGETVDPFPMTITVDPGQPNKGTIGYAGYVVNGITNAYVSSARPVVREGDSVEVLLSRTSGSNTAVTAVFTWGSGSSAVQVPGVDVVWDDMEEGIKGVSIVIPRASAFQPSRNAVLNIPPIAGALLGAQRTALTFVIQNEFYMGPLAEWVKLNPTLPVKTTADAWFQADGEGVRSRPLTNGAVAVMTAAVTGPGVLKLAADPAGGADVTLSIKGKATLTPAVTIDGDVYGYLVPEGKQTISLTATSAKGGAEVYALLSDLAYIPLTAAVTPIAPRTGDVVQAGVVKLSWDASSVAQLDGINGVTNTFAVFVAATEKLLPQGQVADLEAGNTSFDVTRGAGAFVWRVAIAVSETAANGTTILFNGTAQKVEAVAAGAPGFDVDAGDFTQPGWVWDADTAQLTADTYVGLRTAFGPLAVANAASVKVKTGSLPSGLKLEKDADGIWWVKGIPSKAASNVRVVLQAMDGKTGGTTLALSYTVAPLPREAYGSYNGLASVDDGTGLAYGQASLTVSAAGKISGKLTLPNSKTYTLTATGYDAFESGVFSVTNAQFVAKIKKETIPLEMAVSTDVPGEVLLSATATATVSIGATFVRDGWSDKEGIVVEREGALRLVQDYDSGLLSKAPGGYYTLLVLPSTDSENAGLAGTGYLTITVDRKGKVKTAGKLADGTAVSLSSVLLLDASMGVPCLWIATAPKTYSGGFFKADLIFTREAVAPGRVLLNGPALWESWNPRATDVLNDGFQFALDTQGGWYAKNDTLKKMYNNEDGLVAHAQSWDVNAAFNAKGTGLNALPACGTAGNVACLKLSVKPKTGLFSGSFREDVGGKTVTRNLVGVLTPSLTDADGLTGTAGGGYYLIPQTTPYKFNQSDNFLLEPDCGCGP